MIINISGGSRGRAKGAFAPPHAPPKIKPWIRH